MSGYQYKPNAKEARAAAMLREAGWSVTEPQCPECHGHGFVWGVVTTGDRIFGSGTASTRQCSRSCPMPTAFYFATAAADAETGPQEGLA